MEQRENIDRRVTPIEQTQRSERKPYHKPSVRYEDVFETQALTCGKVQTTQRNCKLNKKNS